jgi:hypothetical protein
MQIHRPLILKPGPALALTAVVYGLLGTWHWWKCGEYPELSRQGYWVISVCAAIFFTACTVGYAWLKKKEPPRRKGLYRGVLSVAFVLFICGSAFFAVIWEDTVEHSVPSPTFPEPIFDEKRERFTEEWHEQSYQVYAAWKRNIRATARPLDSCVTLTFSLLFAAAQLFRPDPEPKAPKPKGPKPPPLPIAEGMKSRVVTDKWWEKYR